MSLQDAPLSRPRLRAPLWAGARPRLNGRLGIFLLAIALPVALLVVWQILSINKMISPVLFPPPTKIWASTLKLIANGKLLDHAMASLILQSQGMILGVTAGVASGAILGIWRKAEESLETSLVILQAIPTMALIPLLILWLDGGTLTRTLVVAYSVFFPVYLATIGAVRQVDRKLVEVGRVLGYSRVQSLFRVILPASLPPVFIGIRQSLKMGWVGVVAAEMLIASDSGLYFMMMEARSFGQTATVYLGLFAFALLGLLSDVIIVAISKLVMPWDRRKEEA